MTAPALLQTLAGRGVILTAEAGALRYRAPAGAMTPELRRQIEAHKAALVQALDAGQQAGNVAKPDPRAGRLVHGDFARARARLAALLAELDAGAAKLADLPRDQWSGDLVDELNTKGREAARLAAVAEYQTFDALEEATGKAYQAHCGNPSDPALLDLYRRLDDAWSTVLGLPEDQAPAALVSPDQLARTQDEVRL